MKFFIVGFLLISLFASCGKDNEGGEAITPVTGNQPISGNNPQPSGNGFELKFKNFTADTRFGFFLMNVCVGAVRFNLAGDPNTYSAVWSRKLIEISSNGTTTLGNLGMPAGTYTKITLELDDLCPDSYSLFVQNDRGAFFIPDTTLLNFVGNVTMTPTGSYIQLNLQNYVDLLEDVTTSTAVKPAIDSTAGEI